MQMNGNEQELMAELFEEPVKVYETAEKGENGAGVTFSFHSLWCWEG